MNMLGICLPKCTGKSIYLPEDDEDDDIRTYTSENGFTSCCLMFHKTRGSSREGLIQLPEGAQRQTTLDDYLDPRSPVSIEALLAEQEEELDHYYGQTDDEDAYHGPTIATNKYTPLSLTLVDTFASSFFEEEDAQFLSEHRISAILVDRPKLSDAHLLKEPNNDNDDTTKEDSFLEQDFVDEPIPTTSASINSVSSRVFAIKMKDEDDEQQDSNHSYKMMTDAMHISSSPKELKDFKLSSTAKCDHHTVYPSSSLSSSVASSTASLASSNSKVKCNNNESLIPSTQKSTILDSNSLLIPAVPIASSSSLSFQNNHHHHQQQYERSSDFPATTLTRVPYQPPPAMETNIPSQPLHQQPATQFSGIYASATSSTLPQQQHQQHQQQQSIDAAAGISGRRPSVVAAAQNMLGDKLEDFTEKLAFIKKNIIMRLDSDDEEEDEHDRNNHYYSTSGSSMMKLSSNNRRDSATLLDPRHKMASSVDKSWDSFLPKFNNNKMYSNAIKYDASLPQQQEQQPYQHVLPPARSSSMDHQQSLLLDNRMKKQQEQRQRRFSNMSTYGEDEEDPFDFGKISKNVRTFGEGVMGNGLRMFNTLSTRIKNANHTSGQYNDEFEAHQQPKPDQQQQNHVELL